MTFTQSNRNSENVNPLRIRTVILSLLSLGLIAVFVYYLYTNSYKYINLLQVSPLPIILVLLLTLPSPFLNGLINTLMFRGLGVNFSYKEGFLLAGVSTLANQLPVSGGIVAKGIYLKHKHHVSYGKYISATFALFFCTISVYGIIGLATLLYWFLIENISVASPLFIGFAVMTISVSIFWLPLDSIKIPNTLYKRISPALEGWTLISRNTVLLPKLLAIQTGMMCLLAVRYWLAFHMLSQDVTASEVILFSSASVLTQLVSIAPGGLGIREAIVGAVALMLGFDVGVSVVAVSLDRVISTSVILLVGGISTIILGKQISELSSTAAAKEV